MKKITYNTLDEVKVAVAEGATVYWNNTAYVVKLSKSSGDYNIVCSNGYVAYMGHTYKANYFYSIA